MSSAGQIVGGIVGAVIGFYVGGPLGALQGAALGAGVGGVLDPPKGPTVQGPRLQDKGIQTSTYGAAIPRIYGTIAGGGNIIQLENNKLKEKVRKKESGGKGGGGSTTVKTYTYSATFQLSLCEGPISGVRRIWCGDKLIYNAGSDDLETIIASNKAASGFRVYLGTDDQLPDPRYEAEYGVGNVSAHRGEAYIAFYDFQLADFSNTLQGAQFKVEIVGKTTDLIFEQIAVASLSGSFSGERCGVYSTNTETMYLNLNSGAGRGANKFVVDQYISETQYFGQNGITSENTGVLSTVHIGPTPKTIYLDGVETYKITESFATLFGSQKGDFLYVSGLNGTTRKILKLSPSSTDSLEATVSLTSSQFPCVMGDKIFSFSYSAGIVTVNLYDDDLVVYETFTFPSSRSPTLSDSLAYSENDVYYFLGLDDARSIIRYSYNTDEVVDIPITPGSETIVASSMHVAGSLVRVTGSNNDASIYFLNLSTDIQNETLSNIVNAECYLSSLISVGDIDTSLLTTGVRGYRVSGGSIRAALEPLQAAFPFDARQHGYQIQFIPRGQASIAEIPWDDLGATDTDTPGEIFRQSREMDSQLPARTAIKYLDAAREYAISEQYSERLNTEAVNRVDRELPIVLTANEAAGVAEVLNFLPWLERTDAAFTLPPTYRYLEPGDVVTVVTTQSTDELRITETSETTDGRVECKARPNRAALYTSTATGAEGVTPDGTIGVGGPSLFVPLDIPTVDETVQNAVGFVGIMTGYSDGWPGALAVRSSDGGQTWTDLQAYIGKASIGIAVDALSSSNCTLIDQSTLTVGMISGTPEGITRDQMLTGANYAAYGLDGRWEIVRFQNAELQVDGSYLLSGFVRGERGTEWATGLHAAGDYFVLLEDTDNAFIGSSVETIGLSRTYRGVTAGDSIDDATDVEFTYQGVNLECLSPVYAKGVRDGSSNFTGTFTRRSRLSSSWWVAGVVAPVGETTESYEIDVMNGSSVVRTITASSPTFAYSAANQTTDFGSAQSSITFKIYQLSETVGRGYPLEVTL